MTQLFTLKKLAILSLLILLPACGRTYEVRTAYKQLRNGCVYQELHGVMEESVFDDDDFFLQKKIYIRVSQYVLFYHHSK